MKMSNGLYGRRFGRRFLGMAFGAAALAAGCGSVSAEEVGPQPWGIDFAGSASPVMDSIEKMHSGLLIVITVITLFVTALMVIAMLRFNARANPVPSKTTHNTMIEVAWTIIPVLILVGIAVPSFRLLFEQLDIPKADLTVKATGKQWYWSYTYPDNGKFEFDSLMSHDKQPRMLAVDNELVVPVNKVVVVHVTGADVIHSFGVPAFGIKVDAIPGRLNETWFKATKTGMFYGQCSELCGRDHAFMPIAVRVVSEQDFAAWVETAKKKFASNPANAVASAADVMH
jgi:cytochrome c oxidase subunit 2